MMKFKKIFSALHPHDLIVIIFSIFLIIVNLIFYQNIQHWTNLIFLNVIIVIFVAFTAYKTAYSENKIIRIVHNWYVAPIILITFKQLYYIIKPIHSHDYDNLLIEIDRWIFGTDPTVWLAQISFPLLTEIVQLAYSSFYFLFIIIGFEFFKRNDLEKFYYVAFLIIYGFYLSYVGYFFLPAIGPRFTLHSFGLIDIELPGIYITNYLRDFVNFGESIIRDHPDPALIVQRDVFPSGHTQLTLVLLYITQKYKMKIKNFIWITGILLIFGTVYLRYHYVIDLIAGAVFMLLTIWSAKYVYNGWNKLRTKWKY